MLRFKKNEHKHLSFLNEHLRRNIKYREYTQINNTYIGEKAIQYYHKKEIISRHANLSWHSFLPRSPRWFFFGQTSYGAFLLALR